MLRVRRYKLTFKGNQYDKELMNSSLQGEKNQPRPDTTRPQLNIEELFTNNFFMHYS